MTTVASSSRATRRARASSSAFGTQRHFIATASNLALVTGAFCVAASAYIHLHLWQEGYRNLHIVGPLFLAQAVTGFVMAGATIATRSRLVAVAGALFLLATIGGLVTSDLFGLFGFHDSFDAPYAGLSLWAEGGGATVLVVGALLRHSVQNAHR